MRTLTRRYQGGWGMIEIIGVLGILAAAAVLLSQQIDNAESKVEPQAFAGSLYAWVSVVRDGAPSDLRGVDLDAALLQAPPEWIVSRTPKIDVRHPFGGAVTLTTANWRGVSNRALQYSLTTLPREACAAAAQAVSSRATTLSVGRTALKTQPSDGVTRLAAMNACNAASNTLTWTEL